MTISHAARFACSLLFLFVLALAGATVHAADPLASWNDGPAKSRIVGFVQAVTDNAGKDYVPPSDRIAVFDNDGTLWAEQPAYFQLLFAIDRVRAWRPPTHAGRRSSRSRRPSKAT